MISQLLPAAESKPVIMAIKVPSPKSRRIIKPARLTCIVFPLIGIIRVRLNASTITTMMTLNLSGSGMDLTAFIGKFYHAHILPCTLPLMVRYGKITGCMNIEHDRSFQRPKIIQAFVAGFNTTTNHIHLIILPILLDFFIWFGPHFSLNRVLSPSLQALINNPEFDTPELQAFFQSYADVVQELLQKFNLSSLLRTIPVGVPSLISGLSTMRNPIGTPIQFEFKSLGSLLAISLGFILIGLITGSLYFQQTARSILADLKKRNFLDFVKSTLQAILIPLVIMIILLMITIPLTIIVSILSLISPAIGQIGLLVGMVLITWILIPLIFTPHSIFLFRQNLIPSMLSSISIVRYSLPGSTLFLSAALLLSEGMSILWRVPPEDSWMLLVGIFGHAFISTAILASTYHYFLDAAQYTQAMMSNINKKEIIT